MKILLIHQYFKEGDLTGGVRFNEMTKIWQNMGHEISVIAGTIHGNAKSNANKEFRGRIVTKTDQEGITVWRCYVSKSYNTGFIGRLWGYFSFVLSGIYATLFKIDKAYDVILVTSPPLFVGIIADVAARKLKSPYIFEVRDLWPESAIDIGVLKNKFIIQLSYWLEKQFYKRAAKINVLTPAFRKKLLETKKVPEKKLTMIPNAADFSLSENLITSFNRQQFRKKHQLENYFVITYIGAHGIANGLYQVLETAKLLKDTNVLFLLIGNGKSKEQLIKQAHDENINNVRFIDPVPKKEVLKFVLASEMGTSILLKNDTFKTIYSNKTFDYMSCKRPILMAIDGISRELVEEADAGTYVEPENPEDFENKIRYYLNNPNLVEKQGKNGYYYAKKHFDRKVLATQYLNSLIEVSN